MAIQYKSETSVAAQYERELNHRSGVAKPFPIAVAAESYREFLEVCNELGDPEDLGWMPSKPSTALGTSKGPLRLRHLSLNVPLKAIDATMNGAVNGQSLTTLGVGDPNHVCPSPLRFDEHWTSRLEALAISECEPDQAWLSSRTTLRHLALTGSKVSPEVLPPNLEYLTVQDSDLKRVEKLDRMKKLRALRIVACRGVADASKFNLSDLQHLESLVLSGFARTESLDFLAELPNIRFLGLGGFSQVSDVSPILRLPNLEIFHSRHPGLRGAETSALAELLDRKNFRCLAGFWPTDFGGHAKVEPGETLGSQLPWQVREHFVL